MARHRLYPESVRPGIPKLPPLPPGWRAVPFGELLAPVSRPAELDDETTYQLVTAKRSRGGIVPREELTGTEIKTKTQFYVRGGDFLISRRQIIHGACGFVPEALSGAVVSGEYDVLEVKPALLPEYLEAFTHTTYFQQTCFQSSVGVDIEKMVFDLEHWFTYRMPLPPLAEQRRIAGVLGRIKAALRANERALEQARRVKKALLQRLLSEGVGHARFRETEMGRVPEGWETVALGDLLEGIVAGVSPLVVDECARPNEWGVLKVSAIGHGRFNAQNSKRLPADFVVDCTHIVSAGDVLISRANTAELVGAVCMVPSGHFRLMLSDKTLRLVPGKRITGPFLAVALETDYARHYFGLHATGSSSSMKNISQETIRALRLPLPPLPEQRHIAALVSTTQTTIDQTEATLGRLRSLLKTSCAIMLERL